MDTIETKLLCASSSNLVNLVNSDERMNPIDFRDQRSNIKVTMGLYGNNLVNTIESELLGAFSSNWSDMLTIVRG